MWYLLLCLCQHKSNDSRRTPPHTKKWMNAVKKRTFKLAKKCAHQNGKYNKNPVNKLNYTRNVGMSSNGNVYLCIFSLNFWWFFTIFMAFAWTTHSIIIQTYFFLPFYYSVQKIKNVMYFFFITVNQTINEQAMLFTHFFCFGCCCCRCHGRRR